MSVVLSAREIFSMALEVEKSGRAYYQTVVNQAPSQDLKEFFTYLADQEQVHYGFFKSLNDEIEDFSIDQEDWEQISEYIRASTETRFFIGEEKAISFARQAKDMIQAIDFALGFEKDTLLFFYELLNVTPPRSKTAVQKIVDEEKRHIKLLAEKRKTLQ
ncbi:MAG: hypothetical protein E4H36_15270 [Spirochaetales bacterium]|nr:MAG: hypothetical protein E4H36_15270 [Spirochaetales bacterium]